MEAKYANEYPKVRKKTQKVSQNFYLTYFIKCFFEKCFYSFSCVPKKSAHAPPLCSTFIEQLRTSKFDAYTFCNDPKMNFGNLCCQSCISKLYLFISVTVFTKIFRSDVDVLKPSCYDINSVCPLNKHLCFRNMNFYLSYEMHKNCAYTCGFCERIKN
jgi:hypothetical protein